MGGTSWVDYYDEYGGRPPREMLLEALDAFEDPGDAIDLGCGSGVDTLAMLERGWRVLAVDAEPEGVSRARGRVSAELAPRLETRVARMEDVDLPATDLLWAGFSLFFCPPARFQQVWRRIRTAIRPSGRFAGQILGDRDEWASDPEISWFDRSGVDELLDGWTVEHLEEEEKDDAGNGQKHWHVFHVIARAPSTGGPREPRT